MAFQQKRAELAEADGASSARSKFSANLADETESASRSSTPPQPSQAVSSSPVPSLSSAGLIAELFAPFKLSFRDQFIVDRIYLKLKWSPDQLRALASKFTAEPDRIQDRLAQMAKYLKEKFSLPVPEESIEDLALAHPGSLVFQFKDRLGKTSSRVIPAGSPKYQRYSMYRGLVMESVDIADTFFAAQRLTSRAPTTSADQDAPPPVSPLAPADAPSASDQSLSFASTVAAVSPPPPAKRFSI